MSFINVNETSRSIIYIDETLLERQQYIQAGWHEEYSYVYVKIMTMLSHSKVNFLW